MKKRKQTSRLTPAYARRVGVRLERGAGFSFEHKPGVWVFVTNNTAPRAYLAFRGDHFIIVVDKERKPASKPLDVRDGGPL